jgi:hypothetical protein
MPKTKKRRKLTHIEKILALKYIEEEINTGQYPLKQAVAIGISRAKAKTKTKKKSRS